MKRKKAKRISCHQTYPKKMAKGISLNRKDVIKQKILTGQGEINTITKSTGKNSRISISS